MLIFDGDYPMAHGALGLNRDLTRPLDELRDADAYPSNIPFGCLPEMRRGGVYCALMKIAARRMHKGSILPGYRGKEVVYAAGKGQLAEIDSIADYGKLVPILERRGYGSEDVANVMYGNWHRFYTSYLPQ